MVVPLNEHDADVFGACVVSVLGHDQPVMQPMLLYVGVGEADDAQEGAASVRGHVATVVGATYAGGVYVLVGGTYTGDDCVGGVYATVCEHTRAMAARVSGPTRPTLGSDCAP